MDANTLISMIQAEDLHPWYRGRLQLVKSWGATIPSNSTGVDLGCGSGAAAQLLIREFAHNVTGFDISQYAVDASLQRGVTTFQSDVTTLPLEDASLDFAIALDVVEHIEDRYSLLTEISRVLKPSGKCLITVPAHMYLWSNHDVLNHHFRRYSKSELIADIESCGLVINRIRWWNSIFLPYIYITRLLKRKAESSEFETPPKVLSRIVELILKTEANSPRFLGRITGVSLVAEVSKP